MFKMNWEKTSATHELPHDSFKQMVALAYQNILVKQAVIEP